MFTKGIAVGSIQPYFLSQTDQNFDKAKPLSDPANKAAVEAQAVKTAELLAEFIAGAKHRLDIAINGAARRGLAVRIAYDKDQEDHTPGTIDDFLGAGSDPAPDGTNQFVESDRFDARVLRQGITTE